MLRFILLLIATVCSLQSPTVFAVEATNEQHECLQKYMRDARASGWTDIARSIEHRGINECYKKKTVTLDFNYLPRCWDCNSKK